jgi:hypothetical protein
MHEGQASAQCLVPIAVPIVGSHRNEPNRGQTGERPQPGCQLVAIHPRQSEIEERDFGRKTSRESKRARCVVRHATVMPYSRKKIGEQVGAFLVVVHDQDLPSI